VWIRIGFSAEPDPAFYVNADPDPEIQINADPGQTLPSLKDEVATKAMRNPANLDPVSELQTG
jgi:hypothetical protein